VTAGRANALRNLTRRPFRASIADKALSRLSHARHRSERSQLEALYEATALDPGEFMASIDADLAGEAEAAAAEISARAATVLPPLGINPLIRGDHRLLYFLVRRLRPETVVETGVAVGFTSAAILAAMDANGAGTLWSSDLPYVRYRDPEQLVGVLVPADRRQRWHLLLDGDRSSLRRIAAEAGPIDLLHYDSDKSWRGRERALRTLGPSLGPDAVVLFDDVNDNGHFEHHKAATSQWGVVFSGRGSFVGLTAPVPIV
jgi:predicted O-methyltransferase YrrM